MIFKRSDGFWWRWNGLRWIGPFETEAKAHERTTRPKPSSDASLQPQKGLP